MINWKAVVKREITFGEKHYGTNTGITTRPVLVGISQALFATQGRKTTNLNLWIIHNHTGWTGQRHNLEERWFKTTAGISNNAFLWCRKAERSKASLLIAKNDKKIDGCSYNNNFALVDVISEHKTHAMPSQCSRLQQLDEPNQSFQTGATRLQRKTVAVQIHRLYGWPETDDFAGFEYNPRRLNSIFSRSHKNGNKKQTPMGAKDERRHHLVAMGAFWCPRGTPDLMDLRLLTMTLIQNGE